MTLRRWLPAAMSGWLAVVGLAAGPLASDAPLRTRETALRHPGTVHGLAYSLDGQRLATTCLDLAGGEVRLWDAQTGELRSVLVRHAYPLICVGFSPDGSLLACGGEDGSIQVWDTVRSSLRFRHHHPGARIVSVGFSANGRYLAAAGEGCPVLLWDTLGWRKRELALEVATGLSFSPDSRLLAVSSQQQLVKCWDVASGKERRILKTSKPAWSVAFAPDGATLAVGTEGDLLLWELVGGESRRIWRDGCLPAVAWSGDGRALAAVDYPGERLCLFDRLTGKMLVRLQARFNWPLAVAFAPDGQALAVPIDDVVHLLSWKELLARAAR